MADNYFSAFLDGVLGRGVEFKDFQHASRLYVDDMYALAPKQGFLYYVVFNINQAAVQSGQWKEIRQREVGLLVKACDLPKFNITNEVINQYNRKTYVQSKIVYQPVNLTFHDDHSNASTGLWFNYYNYYYADAQRTSASSLSTVPTGFKDTKYEANTEVFQHTTYGLNNGQDKPFFDSIVIYQMNRKQFTSFILLNPIITEWGHDRMEQSSNNKLLENKMTVGYEAVLYGCGEVKKDKPSGFATFHYDLSASPLSILGGGSSSLFGAGGIIPGLQEIFGKKQTICGDESSGSPLSLLQQVIGGVNLLKNAKNLTGRGVAGELLGVATGAIAGFGRGANIPGGGIAGFSLGGVGLNLFNKNSNGASTLAKQAAVAIPKVSQVSQSDIPFPTPDGVAFETDLPSPLPTDSAGLETELTRQQGLQSQITDEIIKNSTLKADFDERIAAAKEAKDDEGLNAIYDEMASSGYTDPDKLQSQLETVNNNIDMLNSYIADAKDRELENTDTLASDNVDRGQSPDATLDSSINPDYQINTENTQIASADDNYPKEGYVA